MKRLVCWALLAYITGICLAKFTDKEYFVFMLGVLGIAFLIKASLNKNAHLYFLFILYTFLLFGGLWFEISDDIYFKPIGRFVDAPITFKCKVITTPVVKNKNREYIVKIYEVYDAQHTYKVAAKTKLICAMEGNAEVYQYGDILQVKSKLYIPAHAMNAGGFNYNEYLKSQNIYTIAYAAPYQIKKLQNEQQIQSISDFCFKIRQTIIEQINRYLLSQEAALLKAMLVGDRTGFTPQMTEDFSRSGLSHLVAVSGMHVAILLASLTYFLRFFKINRYIIHISNSVVTVLFIFITGCTPSVLRAGIMAIIFLFSYLLSREKDTLTSLCLSAFMILLYNPIILFHVGFQLSFCATLCLLLLYQPIYKKVDYFIKYIGTDHIIIRRASEVAIASITAQIGTMPLVAYYFNNISVIALVSNLIIVPLTSIVLMGGMLLCLVGSISGVVGNVVAGFVYFILRFIIMVSRFISEITFSAFTVPSPNILFIIGYFLSLVIIYSLLNRNKHKLQLKVAIVGLCFVVVIAVVGFVWHTDVLEVSFINVGQGDCIVIQYGMDKTILIDAGGTAGESTYDTGKNIVVPYLLKKGIGHIDMVFVSHYHTDHAKGIISVLQSLPVGMLILSPRYESNELQQELIDTADRQNVPIHYLTAGDAVDISRKASIEVLSPSIEQLENSSLTENDKSFVLTLKYGKITFLFTGDIENQTEHYIIEKGTLQHVDVLKVAHHGSSTSTTTEWVDAIIPKYAVISVGRNNFGHPNDRVLERLRDRKAQVFRTDKNGTITFVVNQKEIKKVKLLRKGE